jgi:hypothetical protein
MPDDAAECESSLIVLIHGTSDQEAKGHWMRAGLGFVQRRHGVPLCGALVVLLALAVLGLRVLRSDVSISKGRRCLVVPLHSPKIGLRLLCSNETVTLQGQTLNIKS